AADGQVMAGFEVDVYLAYLAASGEVQALRHVAGRGDDEPPAGLWRGDADPADPHHLADGVRGLAGCAWFARFARFAWLPEFAPCDRLARARIADDDEESGKGSHGRSAERSGLRSRQRLPGAFATFRGRVCRGRRRKGRSAAMLDGGEAGVGGHSGEEEKHDE